MKTFKIGVLSWNADAAVGSVFSCLFELYYHVSIVSSICSSESAWPASFLRDRLQLSLRSSKLAVSRILETDCGRKTTPITNSLGYTIQNNKFQCLTRYICLQFFKYTQSLHLVLWFQTWELSKTNLDFEKRSGHGCSKGEFIPSILKILSLVPLMLQ